MGEKFVRDDTVEDVETQEYVTETRKPAPGMWLAALLLFAALGASMWFWYKAETHVDREPVVLGEHGPKIIADSDGEGRYIIIREGDRSRIVGGTAVAAPGGVTSTAETTSATVTGEVPGEESRAETIATYKTRHVDEFTGEDAAVSRVGETITIENGRVHEATGDKSFSLHDGEGGILLVFFPEPDTRAGEASVKIIASDHVTVTGVLREMPSSGEAQRLFGLSDREAGELTNNRLYLDAYKVIVH